MSTSAVDAKNFLEFVSTSVVCPTTASFVAKDQFVCNNEAGPRIKSISHCFTHWFLRGNGKIEDPIKETLLSCHKFLMPIGIIIIDNHVIAKLGGKNKATTMLSEIFFLMKEQGNGERGPLLNDGCANIFYVEDQDGCLRQVVLRWRGVGWEVEADEGNFSFGLPRDCYIFHKN